MSTAPITLSLAQRFNLTPEQLVHHLLPNHDDAIRGAFDALVSGQVAGALNNDVLEVSSAILALPANKQNVKALEQTIALPDRHQAWLENKAMAITGELIGRATRKIERDAHRAARRAQRKRDREEQAALRSAHSALQHTASSFSTFLVAIDVDSTSSSSSSSVSPPPSPLLQSTEVLEAANVIIGEGDTDAPREEPSFPPLTDVDVDPMPSAAVVAVVDDDPMDVSQCSYSAHVCDNLLPHGACNAPQSFLADAAAAAAAATATVGVER